MNLVRCTYSLKALLLLACVFLTACSVKSVHNPELTLHSSKDAALVRGHLQHGDWLLTRGIHTADNFIATVTNTDLSHASLYDAENHEVLESVANGVVTISLQDLLEKSVRVMVLRPMWASPEVSAKAVLHARTLIGRGYNFTGLVGINMPGRYYCTQLVIAAYQPFIEDEPANRFPLVIKPGQMFHWATIVYDSGPPE